MKSTKLIAGIAISLVLISCSDNPEEQQIEREAVRFQSSTITVDKEVLSGTRATDKFTAGDDFTILVRDGRTASGITKFPQQTLIAEAEAPASGISALNTTPTIYWDDLGGRDANLRLFGIYWNEGITGTAGLKLHDSSGGQTGDLNFVEWTVSAAQNNFGVDKYDLITAKVESYEYVNKATPPAKLEFEHRMTKVSIILLPHTDGYDLDELEKSSTTVTYNKFYAGDADFNITANTFDKACTTSGRSSTKAAIANIAGSKYAVKNASDATTGYAFTIITYPGNVTASSDDTDPIATITVAGNDYKIKLDADNDFKPGVHTTYEVTIKKTEVTVTASLADWKPDSYTKEARLITADAFGINFSTISPKDGTTVTMKITGSGTNDAQTAIFTYDSNATKWTTTKAAYWDNLTEPIIKVEGLLLNGGTLAGENCFTGKTANGTTYDLRNSIALGEFFTHPLTKVSIIVKTSTGTDKVVLKDASDGIQSITIPGCGGFTIGSDLVSIVSTDIPVDYTLTAGVYTPATGDGSGSDSDNVAEQYACGPFYFYPKETAVTRLFAITIKQIINGDSHTNTYYVDLSSAQIFEAGKHYTYTVTIKKTGVTFSGTLKDWTTAPKDLGDIYL